MRDRDGVIISTRAWLFGSIAVAALTATLPAVGQTTQITPSAPATQTDTVPSGTAANQTSEAAASGAADTATTSADVVVTGTLLRGIAPTGANVIGLTRADVVATGAKTGADLLATIPQVTNQFNSLPSAGATLGGSNSKPILRNLGASAGSTTLVLLDGHRLIGTAGGVFDPGVLPPSVIERVEVLPDGGSSIYGSDAIGGVINFITRRKVDGVEINGSVGGADAYLGADGTITAGKDWSTGSALLSFTYGWHSNLSGFDRAYDHANNAPYGGLDRRSTSCTPGNITAGGISYALPGRTPGTNFCEDVKANDIYPAQHRQAVFASITQNVVDGLQANLTGFWAHQGIRQLGLGNSAGSGAGASGTINNTNPYFSPIGAETSQSVAFSFANVFGPARVSTSSFDSWQLSPSLRYQIGGSSWEVRAEGNYGRGHSAINASDSNQVAIAGALAGTTVSTALNPYNPGASNAAVPQKIDDFENYYHTVQSLATARLVTDGSLFSLPGGDVKVAIGAEYYRESDDNIVASGPREALVRQVSVTASRHITSVFGEINVPLVGAANAMSGISRLAVNGSVRHDDYNDVGGTTNGKIGAEYAPVDQLRIHGTWSTSFHAPSLLDGKGAADSRAQVLPFSPFLPSTAAASDGGRATVLIAGGNPNLKPETARSWSAGADWSPDFASGLKLSATYWDIRFKNAISVTPFFSGSAFFNNPSFNSFYTINPTLAQAQALLAGLRLDGITAISDLYANGKSPYIIINATRNNLGAVNIGGIDFNASYNHPTSFGSISASFGGTKTTHRQTQASPGSAFVNDLANGTADLTFVGTAGARIGGLSGRMAVNYSGGYPLTAGTQTSVSSFTTVDLFINYDLKAEGFLKNTSFSLNVRNLLDQDPPYFDSVTGYANGATLGRYVQFGVTKRF